jgi:TRAP-type C4-dicarboxylate transport system permease small subunit
MRAVDFILDRLERWLCVILFSGMTIAVLLQIVFRSTGLSLAWTEELARELFVGLMFLGAV